MLIVFLIFVHKCIAPFSALSGPGVLSWFVEICQWPDLLMSKLYWNTSILEMLWNVTKYGIQYRDPLKNTYLLAKIGTDTADILVTKWHQISMKTRSCRSLLRALVLAWWYRGILTCWATMATYPEWKKLIFVGLSLIQSLWETGGRKKEKTRFLSLHVLPRG